MLPYSKGNTNNSLCILKNFNVKTNSINNEKMNYGENQEMNDSFKYLSAYMWKWF